MPFITMIGKENDLNRELSRRGLFRKGSVSVERGLYEPGQWTIRCEIQKNRNNWKILQKWFEENNRTYLQRLLFGDYPEVKLRTGDLEGISW